MELVDALSAHLDFTLRVIGFLAALGGTCAAVPAATWRMIHKIRARVGRWLDRLLNRSTRIHVGSGSGRIHITGSGRGVSREPINDNGTAEQRLERLEAEAVRVRSQVDRIDLGLDQEQRERRAEHRQLADRLSTEIESLRQILRQGAEQAEEVDARALPTVLVALILTTFAENLSENAVSGVVAALAGLGVLIIAARLVVKARPPEPIK